MIWSAAVRGLTFRAWISTQWTVSLSVSWRFSNTSASTLEEKDSASDGLNSNTNLTAVPQQYQEPDRTSWNH